MTSNNKSIKPRALTDNDIRWFFEALGEHGKDFNSIHNYIAQRSGKAGLQADQIRSREQIRNFYNRLYNRLSQLITITNDVDKVTQELYLLINYGEIWKKFGFKYTTRIRQLLNGLVNDGHTTYKMKKGHIRFRTPSCKALRRLHEITVDDKLTVLTSSEVPKDVLVEFHPATNRDWLIVQSIAQNPRVRAKLSLQKRLSSVINFLENKWNVKQDRIVKSSNQWLKLPQQVSLSASKTSQPEEASTNLVDAISGVTNEMNSQQQSSGPTLDPVVHSLRLKPSIRVHDLGAITLTRVVPDCQMNLSLQAYISKMPESKNKNINLTNGTAKSSVFSNNQPANQRPTSNNRVNLSEQIDEKTCTQSGPIDQAQKQLNVLQSMLASIDGCENSRTNCEDTFDRMRVPPVPLIQHNLESEPVLLNEEHPSFYGNPTRLVELDSPQQVEIPLTTTRLSESSRSLLNRLNDEGATQSVDLPMPPPNMTIAEWFDRINHNSSEAHAEPPISKFSTEQDPIIPPTTSAVHKEQSQQSAPQQMIDPKRFSTGWTSRIDSQVTIGELYLAFKCPDKIVLDYEFELANDNDASNKSETIQPNLLCDSFLFKLLTTASVTLASIQNSTARGSGGSTSGTREQNNNARNQKRRKIVPTTISRTVSRTDGLTSSDVSSSATCGSSIPHISSANLSNTPGNFNLANANNTHSFLPPSRTDSRLATLTSGLSDDDIELTNQKVEEELRLLQPTRLRSTF